MFGFLFNSVVVFIPIFLFKYEPLLIVFVGLNIPVSYDLIFIVNSKDST